jgi:hypothetical protein
LEKLTTTKVSSSKMDQTFGKTMSKHNTSMNNNLPIIGSGGYLFNLVIFSFFKNIICFLASLDNKDAFTTATTTTITIATTTLLN